MDPFVVIVVGGAGGLMIALLLLGRSHSGSNAEHLGSKPTRSRGLGVPSEIDDLDQMLTATNARRRAHGKPELTEDSLSAEIAREAARAHRRRPGSRP
jgi:hypothetical protein